MFAKTKLRDAAFIIAALFCVGLAGCQGRTKAAADVDWAHYDGDYAATRFVDLSEITPQNIKQLRPACEILLGDEGPFQTAPLIVDGTLYVTTGQRTGAFDAATCRKKWVTAYTMEQTPLALANRGAALLDNRVFRGFGDGRLIAMATCSGRSRPSNPNSASS